MFQKSDLTQSIHDLLAKVNGHITYDAISRHVGLPLSAFRAALNSARRALEREHGTVFAVERGLGLRRLDDAEKVRSTHQMRQAITRKAKRGIRRLDAVQNYNALPLQEQTLATINRTVFQAAHDAAKLASGATTPAEAAPVPDVAKLVQALGLR